MRSNDVQQEAMFSYLSPEARVPREHPVRPIRDMVNKALAGLSGEYQAMYSREGRPGIPREKLLSALLLQVLCTNPQRPAADGAVGLQPPVSMVCRALHGRQGLGPFRFF